MRFGVLGPVAVWTTDGAVVPVPGLKVRALLAALLVHEGRPVSADRLVEYLWGDNPPGNPAGALSVKVSQLRRALEDAEPGGRELVVSPPPGYSLRVEAVDAYRFAELTGRARETAEPGKRAALLADALALWRGPALADFADEPFTRATTTRLAEQRLAALEDWSEARIALGEHAAVAAELAGLLAEHPSRERLRGLHMRALYRSGRQAEALRSYDELRDHLAEELGLDPGPALVDLHRAILTQDPELTGPATPASAADRPTSNLPAPLTDLVGREEAVAELGTVLRRERLVTLTGPGGVGKTRLAVRVAAPWAEQDDGAWLVELATLHRPDAPEVLDPLADMVLAALDVRDTAPAGRPEPQVDRLTRALRTRRLLLVLDNCEHLVESVAELAGGLLRAVPGLRILATSREPLGLAGEVVWPVPPLTVPGPADAPDVETVRRSPAVRLFVARAASAARGFRLDADNAPAVATLCQRLDGLPLALELAATRVRALGVPGLLAGLDDRFRLLATGHRGAPPRQQTLLAMIDWSWQLLTDPERRVLRRLAVHADGCTLAAAQAVCASDGEPAEDVPELLARLVDRSLVVVTERAGDEPRYRLLESVAAYCVERLHDADEVRRIRDRHRRHYTELAERAEPELYGPDQRRWLRRLDAEAANLRAALDNTLRAPDPDLALRLVNALTWYWFLRGRLTEAERSLRAALLLPGGSSPAARARATAWHTGILFLRGDVADWPARHAAVMRGYAELDDPTGRARAEWFLGYAEIDLGDVTDTGLLLDRVLAAFEAVGDRWGVAATLGLRAKHAHVTGDVAALDRDGRRSADLFREIGDRWGLLQATEWLGAHAGLTGEYDRAAELHRDGLRMAEELDLWADVSGRLSWLGWVAMQRGAYQEAREYCQRGLRLATEQAAPLLVVFAELGLAFAARRAGSLDVAETHLRGLLDTADRQDSGTGRPLYVPSVLSELGYVEELRGDPAAAVARHLAALAVARELGAAGDTAQALAGLAGAYALGGRYGDAARLLGAADSARESMRLPVTPAERGDLDRATATARSGLGEADFASAFAQGRRLDPEQLRELLDRALPTPTG
ncbi:BTAD domain-containing putative transcriptional regulator [Plantactinospora endophytica]|nr:BTAD domain-containing putative transcriptional regulator [Plantactinospora endophytica]